jgi:hypothetical protein
MIEPDDGGLGGNLDMVTDFQWIHPLNQIPYRITTGGLRGLSSYCMAKYLQSGVGRG